MIIGGFEPLTLTDYPGTVACIVFTVGCNLRCGYCYNKDLITKKWFNESYRKEYSSDKIFNYIKKNKMMIDGVVITGGEPLLNNSIVVFCKELKKLGVKIKIDTNGTNPALLQKLICLELIDYVAMDVKAPLDKYDIVGFFKDTKCVEDSIKIIRSSGLDHEFRVTMHPKLGLGDYKKICKLCSDSKVFFQDLMMDSPFLDEKIKDLPQLSKSDKEKLNKLADCKCVLRYS